LRIDEPLKLLQFDILSSAADSAAAEKEKQDKSSHAAAAGTAPGKKNDLFLESGVRFGTVPRAAFDVGWRFRFSPLGKLIELPFQLSLEYIPKADSLGAGVGFGVQSKLPIDKVPIVLRFVPGVAGGFHRPDSLTPETPLRPFFGPSFDLSAGIGLGSGVQIYLDANRFSNLLKDASEKGSSTATTFKLGVSAEF
jgi:hypothetical protein